MMDVFVKVIEQRLITFVVEADSIADAEEIVGDGDFPNMVETFDKVKDVRYGKYASVYSYSTKPPKEITA